MTEQSSLPLGEKTLFFKYDQNNSGGSFYYDDNLGENVLVEAHSPGEADQIAEGLGIYFDGCGDCPCCGRRWSEAGGWSQESKPDGYSVFATAEEAIAKHAPDPAGEFSHDRRGSQLVIHYLDGRREWHFRDAKFR